MRRHIILCFLLSALGLAIQLPPAVAQGGARATSARAKGRLQPVKIYLTKDLQEGEPYDPNNPSNLHPVTRMVNRAAPLRPTLIALMAGPSAREKARGYIDISFGIKLSNVRMKEGTVLAEFTMPPGAAFSGDTSPFIFQGAVEKTIKQFPGVKKVIVCLDGEIDIGSESGEPPRKCPPL